MVWYAAVYLQSLVLTMKVTISFFENIIVFCCFPKSFKSDIDFHCPIFWECPCLMMIFHMCYLDARFNWICNDFVLMYVYCKQNTEVPWRGFPLKKFSVVSFSWKYTLPRSYLWRLNSQSPKDTIPHIECLLRNLLWDTFLLNEPSELSGNKFWQ